MGSPLSSAVCAAVLLLPGASLTVVAPPTQAAMTIQIGFNYFHNRLEPYGRWIRHPL